MLKVVGATCRRALEQTIRVLGEAVSMTVMFVLALAPAAAAIALGYLLMNPLMAISLLALASLGPFVVWCLREVRNRRADRSWSEQPIQPRDAVKPPVVVPAMSPIANDLLAFHDFNRQRNRFDHW